MAVMLASTADWPQLSTTDGMGHSLPRQLWPQIATHIAAVAHHAEAITATT
jgi:hypothetical protein